MNMKKRTKVYHSLIKGCHIGSCMAVNQDWRVMKTQN